MTFDQTIGRNIQALRNKFGLTQQALTDRTGIQRVSICQYETGERRVPTKDLEKIAGYFNVNLEDLFEENKDEFNFNTAFAFRADNATNEDYTTLGKFKEIFNDFCRQSSLLKENELTLN